MDTDDIAHPRITLEQWRALRAVVEKGGYARAAEALHKSQTAITYAIQKLETLLNVRVLTLKGRRAELTEAGKTLYRRARILLEEAAALERLAGGLGPGFEPELRFAVEAVFPQSLFLESIASFRREYPETRIEVFELTPTCTEDALLECRVDLAVSSRVPPGFVGDHLMHLRVVPVAAPTHPLHRLARPVTDQDLRWHCEFVVRDSSGAPQPGRDDPMVHQRVTVGQLPTAILAITAGFGFGWLPEDSIRGELESGRLMPLPMCRGGERYQDFFLVLALGELAAQAPYHLAALLRERAAARASAAGRHIAVQLGPRTSVS